MSNVSRVIALIGLALILWVGWMMTDAIRHAAPPGPVPLPEIVSDGGYPIEIRQPFGGGTLTIERPPMRILPGNAGAVDLLTILVEPSRLAALPDTTDDWSRIHAAPEGYEEHHRFESFTAEILLSHDPDLVVTSPFNQPDTIRRLEDAGVAVLRLPDLFDVDAVCEVLELLGRVLDVEDTAQARIEDIRERESRLLARHEGRPSLRAVAYMNYGFGGTASGSRTTHDEVFRLAGLRNAVAEAGHVEMIKVNFEDLIALDPDLIVVSHREDGGTGVTEDVLLGEPSLQGLRAVRGRRIVSIPARLFSTVSQEIIAGAERLADAVDRLDAPDDDEGDPR